MVRALFTGPDEAVQRVAGVEEAEAGGAVTVMPIQPTPNGHRAELRHPHGGVYEYVGP